ncbi:hypothetical protein Tco_1019356 [Tanacetum coccineum]|uniref:Uncharacterized protein n=1 Tax=Tanacetum coccineum TaxID=301880 RepID=A0ABQ5FWW2_9ASTR
MVFGHKVLGAGIEKIRKRFLTSRSPNDVHKGKLSLRVGRETVTFNIRKSMKSKHSSDIVGFKSLLEVTAAKVCVTAAKSLEVNWDQHYLYCVDHTAKHVQEQWIDAVDHDGKWTDVEKEEDYKKVQADSFYPRTEPVKPLEWKALENRLKPSSIESPKLELKELPKHL